jgi:hypothetical protein
MPEPENTGFERRDVNPRAVRWAAIWLIVALIVTFIGMRILESVLSASRHGRATQIVTPRFDIPPPRLETNPAVALAKLRAMEDARLHGYGWVDRGAGIIHIPIERAMELTVERGLPARASAKGGAR